MLTIEALQDVDAEIAQHCRHRRIDVLIRSSDVMPARLEHSGERSHRSAADPDQVIVHSREMPKSTDQSTTVGKITDNIFLSIVVQAFMLDC